MVEESLTGEDVNQLIQVDEHAYRRLDRIIGQERSVR